MSHPIGLATDLSAATPEQYRVHQMIANGPRSGVPNPFLAMLDAPDLAMAIQEIGVIIRYRGVLPASVRELAILATASAVNCGYEWNYHAPIAASAGVSPGVIKATRDATCPDEIDPMSRCLIEFCQETATRRQVQKGLLAEIIGHFGRSGATELIALVGYYSLLASFIIMGERDAAFAYDAIVNGDAPHDQAPSP
jgi:4-carboxymuconolactone decarboxylase